MTSVALTGVTPPATFDPPAVTATYRGSGGDVIVTTRTLQWSRVGAVLEIDVFSRAESVELLCCRGRGIAPADADSLAARLGDLLCGAARSNAPHP